MCGRTHEELVEGMRVLHLTVQDLTQHICELHPETVFSLIEPVTSRDNFDNILRHLLAADPLTKRLADLCLIRGLLQFAEKCLRMDRPADHG